MPPRPAPAAPSLALTAALALGLSAGLVLALRPGPAALFPQLAALVREVATHDSDALRLAHDGWAARLAPVYAAIEALPANEPVLLSSQGVPVFFVGARFPARRVFVASDELRADLAASGERFHELSLVNDDPLSWTLAPGSDAPR